MKNSGILAVVLFAPMLILGQSRFANFPSANRSTSPDGRFTLTNSGCVQDCKKADRTLWLTNNINGVKKGLLTIERNARIGWAPSGNTFFLNDDSGSNVAEGYLYFPAEGRRENIGDMIYQKFPGDRRFARNSHHYVNALYWIDTHTVLVKRSGHVDEAGGPEFTVCYRVTTSGEVSRLSESDKEGNPCSVE